MYDICASRECEWIFQQYHANLVPRALPFESGVTRPLLVSLCFERCRPPAGGGGGGGILEKN